MATCKDCLHLDVCYMVEHYGVDLNENGQEYDCNQFQAKTNYVEVVRCKDCKYFDGESCSNSQWWDDDYTTWVKEDDFCSYGERKDNEGQDH